MNQEYIKINTLSLDDTNDLFEAICDKILKISPTKAKRNTLGMTGKDKHLEEHKVTANQILTLISRHDIACEIKVSYSVPDNNMESIPQIPKSDKDGFKKDIVITDMEKQVKEITNPELQNITSATTAEEKKNSIKADWIPPIPDFLG